MRIGKNTPGSATTRVWFDGRLIGGVVQADDTEGWVDVRVVREVAGRRTYTNEIERVYGKVTLAAP